MKVKMLRGESEKASIEEKKNGPNALNLYGKLPILLGFFDHSLDFERTGNNVILKEVL